ncbi:hypothetical protein LZ31DRAFT_550446 [Colletotrichum somersetense]|nr:hypothetical protein LZ31DRAFT_550446 [Colletotrichum somersetense]
MRTVADASRTSNPKLTLHSRSMHGTFRQQRSMSFWPLLIFFGFPASANPPAPWAARMGPPSHHHPAIA